MINNRLPPTPAVENILTIMRRIARGDIRVPAFQRDFVWTEAQVIALFESIYKGFPIGSVLLWSVDTPILREAEYTVSVFPVTPMPKVWTYVLDGMQRLTAIYGVLNYVKDVSDNRLNITFDVRDEKISHADSLSAADIEFNMPLRALFAGKELLAWQSRIISMEGGDEIFDKVLNLQAIFQEYMIPIVTISRDDVSSVVEMFERINNTGTRLDTVDFMRAVTWSNNFDLNASLERINAVLGEINFGVSEQTLVKILGLELGREPMPDTLLTLRQESSDSLNDAVNSIIERLTMAAEFFRENLRIYSSEYVPYEGQLLVVYRALQESANKLDDRIFKDVERWFWAIGFNESLRGKPDHYVARAVKSLDDLFAGKIRGVEPRFELQPRNFRERRFIQRKALSGAVAGIFARNNPRSLVSGEPINVESFMIDFSAAHFNSLLALPDISAAIGQSAPSAKIIANVYVSDHKQRNEAIDRERALEQIVNGALSPDVLKSQLLNDACVEHLKIGDFARFLEERATLMWSAATKMIGE